MEGVLQYRTGWDESVSVINTIGDQGMTFTLKLKVWHSAGQQDAFVDPIRQQYQSMMVNMDEFMKENSQFAKEPASGTLLYIISYMIS